MDISTQDRRRAFSHWMRTGLWPGDPEADCVEVKFNPYHDPRNGQFTFAPGGPRSLSRVIISYGRRGAARASGLAPQQVESSTSTTAAAHVGEAQREQVSNAIYRTDKPAQFERVSRGSRSNRGSNSRAFQDPLTLEQVFPGLRNSPGGSVIAVADNMLDFSGPWRAGHSAIVHNWSNAVINQIQTIEPGYRYDRFGFPSTFQGQMTQLNTLRWTRASLFLSKKGELRPLQVEALRFVQDRTDRAYADGLKLIQSGRLLPHPTASLALGNYIDRRVRRELREQYDIYGINSAKSGPVRVNRREYDSSRESVYFQPDSRVGQVAFDVTLAQKGLGTKQVRGFFSTDFKPTHVIIVRPSQLGARHTYVISRPEKR